MPNPFESKDAVVRIFSGASDGMGGFFYAVGRFLDDFTLPGGPSRPDETTVTDRGIADANMGRVAGRDDPIFDPIPITLGFNFNASLREMITALGNPDDVTPWIVGGDTWAPVTTIGTRINGRGTAVACRLPADQFRRDRLVDIWAHYPAPPSGGSDYFRFALGFSVNPNEFSIVLEDPLIRVTMNGLIYGGMGTAAAFPAGTESVVA